MAEEQQEQEEKFTLKPVDVQFDQEGNFQVKDVEIEEEKTSGEEQKEQEDDSQKQEDDSNDNDDDDDSDDSGSDDADQGEEDDSDDDDASGEEEDEDFEEEEDEDFEEEDDSDDDDVVDYEELPESVQKYLTFFEETGGSLQDFMLVNQDFKNMSQDDVIRQYMKSQYPEFDDEDIALEMTEQFGFDDLDDDKDIRKKKLAKKKFYSEALRSLEEQGKKYKADLGSSAALPQEAKEAIAFKQNFEKQQAQQAQLSKAEQARRSSFVKETNKVLGKSFEGFEVKLGEDTVLYKPENVRKVREQNLDVNNLLSKFTDKEGNVTDVKGYHKALTIASDPEAFASHFYEMGKAAGIEEDEKDSKNISSKKPRSTQRPPKPTNQPKFKIVDIDGSGKKSNGLISLKNY